MYLLKLVYFILLVSLLQISCSTQSVPIDWNDKQLNWLSYEEGIQKLKSTGKRGIFIIYADWCPTCKEYSILFRKPEVVNALKDLVLIRANMDEEKAVSEMYDYDGEYVPRTFALYSDGSIISIIYSKEEEYWYFIPSDDPEFLIQFAHKVKFANEST